MNSSGDTLVHSSPIAVRPMLSAFSRYLPAVLAVALAIVMHGDGQLGPDNSWLLTVGEKWLAGAVPYVDVIETNPPASVLLYMPAIILGHWLGLAPEVCVIGLTFAGVLAGLGLTWMILRGAGLWGTRTGPYIFAAALAVFLVLPQFSFAQREHIAAVFTLPMLALYAAQIAGRSPRLILHLLAGLAGGLCVVIKLWLALPLLLPLGFTVLSVRGGWRARAAILLGPAHWVIVALGCAYVALVLLVFPVFIHDTLPLLADVYLPAGLPLWGIAIGAVIDVVPLVLILRVIDPARIREPLTALLFLSAVGFALAMIIQAKGWPYHIYPILALLLLAVARALIERVAQRPVGLRVVAPLLVGTLGLCAVVGWAVPLFAARSYSLTLNEEVRRLAPAHPKILTISGDIALGHPLVRQLSGTWVDRLHSHWITLNAKKIFAAEPQLPQARRAAIEKWLQFDKASLLNDISTQKPDIILVEEGWWQRWAHEQADIEAALAPYRVAGRAADTTILARRSN